MKRALIAVMVAAGSAHADAPPVNLLAAVPTIVAVSSTVENPAILPAHVVDGKLDTAWNSHTGDLVGAWIDVRIPADAHVDTIKLTVGFTKVDKKWGDLFTMNPRIKRVRVTRDGTTVVEKTLDPALRTLQDIAIGRAGGDYRIEVLEIVPGSRKDWQEINVSELEVWGAPGKSTPASATKLVPVIHVGGFDHDDLTRLQCIAALDVKGKAPTYETADFTGDLSICRIDVVGEHTVDDASKTRDTGTVVIGIVKRGAKPARVAKLAPYAVETVRGEMQMGDSPNVTTKVAYRAVQVTTTEWLLEVTQEVDEASLQYGTDKTTVQLFRIGGGGATNVLEFSTSNTQSTNGGTTEHCKLDDPPADTAKLPAVLDVRCRVHHERYGGNGPEDQTTDTERVDHYKWNGSTYAAP